MACASQLISVCEQPTDQRARHNDAQRAKHLIDDDEV
jgi:hypothetical protein